MHAPGLSATVELHIQAASPTRNREHGVVQTNAFPRLAPMDSLEDVFLAEKEIGHFPGWSNPDPESDYLWFDAPIEIYGIAEAGLVLHGGCFAHQSDHNVSFELRFLKKIGRRCIPLERLDWRSLQGGHSNPLYPRTEWSGIRVSDTHLHEFHLNFVKEEQRMRNGGLRIAREVCRPLETLDAAIEFVGRRLNMSNIQVVTEPSWVYDLFSQGES